MNLKNKIYYFSIWLTLFLIYFVSSFSWIFSFIIFTIFYSSLSYIFYFIYKKIRKQKLLNYKNFLIEFLKKISLSFVILVIFVASFSYYNNELYPAKLPQFTITNWKKIVVFQGMSHIWTKKFYEKIKNEIIKYKKKWFVYFYEWVKPSKDKKTWEDFNKALWIKFDKDTYKYFSKLYWVTNQDNRIFLWLVNNKDFNVDLSLDEIMQEYEKINKNSKNKIQNKQKIIDISQEVNKNLASLNPRELKILRYINRAFLNILLKNNNLQDLIMQNFTNKKLFKIILNKRNKNLAENIINSKYDKIFITYWLLHFDWVFKILKENDSSWRIKDIKFFYPIKD